MKVLVIVDSATWAIARLASIYIEGNPQFHFKTLYIHPREVEGGLDAVKKHMDWADIIIFEYWNTARQLMEHIPALKEKKLVLMHHNQKDLLSYDWSMMNVILCHTKKAKAVLEYGGYKNVEIIPYGLDFNYWKYLETIKEGETFKLGYAGRIVPWKNLKEVAAAAFETKSELLFMGKMDKVSYWEEIPNEHRENMDMSFMKCADDERLNFYHSLDVFINFCSDGREEGTMPLLEAMASGIPVITTASGTAADIVKDGVNGVIVPFDDVDALKAAIERLRGDFELRNALRSKAWETIRTMTAARMARRYSDMLYRLYSDKPLVSVIVPVHNTENLDTLLTRLNEMDYPNVEVVVCDDSAGVFAVYDFVEQVKKWLGVPIKHVYASVARMGEKKRYGLAEARNRGVIEAQGEYLMFCDSRMLPEKDAINKFMEISIQNPKSWLFGDKGGHKTTFVENFSFIRRKDLIEAGMFNERIDQYGGMSQEIRERFMRQGFFTGFVPEAKATQMRGSHMNAERRAGIIAMKDLLWKIGFNNKT